ncbi:MAG: Mur ligase family protein [archaeon]
MENLIVLFDIYTAHKKISKHRKRLIVIGIMGTYGKSSVKDILTTGFKTKYNTCISPNNSNTIKGILRSIKYDLEDHHDILILELDIKKYINSKLIEKYIKFDYLIHTGKDVSKLDYIRDLKHMDIIEKNIINAVKEEGKLLINVNNDYSKEMLKKKYKTNIVPIDIDNEKSPIYLKNIKQGLDFTQFKFISAKCSIDTKTKLLGRQAVENIAISTYIFLDMNYQCGEIEQIITEIKTITGRLEYKTKDNNQHVIDNSKHNSINAFMSANQYIQALDFKNKILITSGIQNLNQTQVLQNMLISKNIYKSFTKCILIKNRTTEKLYKFLLEEGFDKKDIVVINSEEEVEKSLPKTDEESIILVNSL